MELQRISRLSVLALVLLLGSVFIPAAPERHAVPKEHPRLLGSRQELKALAQERKADYQRVVQVARDTFSEPYAKVISLSLVAAIEPLGMLLAVGLFLLIFLAVYLRGQWPAILLIAGGTPVCLYLIFEKWLKFTLPRGFLGF